MPKHFIKAETENIICEKCGKEFVGGGYINHCPFCLWSKHVDEETPGDRKSGCLGLMKPVQIVVKKREKLLIRHKCVQCGKEILNKVSPLDDMEKIIALSV